MFGSIPMQACQQKDVFANYLSSNFQAVKRLVGVTYKNILRVSVGCRNSLASYYLLLLCVKALFSDDQREKVATFTSYLDSAPDWFSMSCFSEGEELHSLSTPSNFGLVPPLAKCEVWQQEVFVSIQSY